MASIILGMKQFPLCFFIPPPHSLSPSSSYPSFTLLIPPPHPLSLLYTFYHPSPFYPSFTLLMPPPHSLSLLYTPYPPSPSCPSFTLLVLHFPCPLLSLSHPLSFHLSTSYFNLLNAPTFGEVPKPSLPTVVL